MQTQYKPSSVRLPAVLATLLTAAMVLPASARQSSDHGSRPSVLTPPSATPNDTLHSPEVEQDNRVTFRLYAPDAHEVKLHAEGLEATPDITPEQLSKTSAGFPMTRAQNGVWSVTIGPIQPGTYRYTFGVDGVSTTDPRNPVASETLASVRSVYEVPGAQWEEYLPNVPHGTIASVWYPSAVTGSLRRMHVYTPPGYDRNSQSYPVLYLLHGGGDSDDSWPTVGRAGAILDNLIAEHKAIPMLVVMPAGHISRDFQLRSGMNTMGHDEFNRDMTASIVPYVDQNFRTIADREHRALAGLSMGGVQTLTLSLTSSDLFSYVGVFSSGWFPTMRDMAERDLATYKANGKPFQLYWVGVGRYDIANANSAGTVERLKSDGVAVVTHNSGGFHAWNNWRDYLHIFAQQLFQ